MENQLNNTAKRPSLNLIKYHEKYGPDQTDDKLDGGKPARSGMLSTIRKKIRKRRLKPTKSCMGEILQDRLPFINMLRTYKLNYFLKDVMSGLTLGVIQIAPSKTINKH